MNEFTTASITMKDLAKHFGAVKAVDQINLTVEEGTLVCLLGPSGCGKTTSLRMVAGFEEPTFGKIFIGQDDVTNTPPYARPTAMVFQSYALFPHMSVYDNIAYGLHARRTPKKDIEPAVMEVVHLMELKGQERKSPPHLSGGQQQRVALARALVIHPKVLLFDEPLSNLDALLRVRMRSEIRSIQRRLGITSLYVTHDQEEAFSIADLVAIMNKGKIVQVGTPRELYRAPADRFVAEFVGLSNIVPVRLLESNREGAAIEVFGQTIQSRRAPRNPNGEISIVLRPEALKLTTSSAHGVPVTVLTLAFTGPLARYNVRTQDGTLLMVDLHNPAPDEFFEEGRQVSLLLPESVPALLG
jgi:iron(III) transport system ATP-binding protein